LPAGYQSLAKSFDLWILSKRFFDPGLFECFRQRTNISTDTADACKELLRLDINPGKHRIRHRRGDIFGKMRDL
jgi:hypothetical protein